MPARKSPLEPLRRAALGAGCLTLAVACDPVRTHEVTIVDGATSTQFPARSAFAEYVELPGVRNELRVTLASYPVSCEHWGPPKEGDTALSLTVVTPADVKPAPGSFPWSGVPEKDTPIHEAYVLPKALLGSRSRLFEPGGAMKLAAVSLELHGSVVGALAFEYPGDGSRPATRIDGGFEAKICRFSPAAH